MKEQCRHFKEQIEAYLLQDLPSGEKRILEEHLSSCEECRMDLEAEKKILGLFQSLEKHPAPETLRTRVMEHIQKSSAPRRTLVQSLDRIFSLPRIHVLTGAVAALLLMFWVIRLFHPPVRTEQPAPGDAAGREIIHEDYSYNREAKGLEERKAGSPAAGTLRYEKKDMNLESAELRDKKEKIMASPPASLAQNGIMENEKAGFAEVAVEERLKGIGAVQIQKLKESDESRGAEYAFFISQQDFDNMQNNTSLKNIRILKVRDRMDASQVRQSLKRQAAGETLVFQSTYDYMDFPKKIPDEEAISRPGKKAQAPAAPLDTFVAKTPPFDYISPSERAQIQEAMPFPEAEPAKPEMKAKAAGREISPPASAPARSSPIQAFSAPSSAISGAIVSSPTPAPHFSMMQKPRTQVMDEGIAISQSIGGPLDKSGPTTPTLEEKQRSLGLTSQPALLYVEIEVEPLK